MRILLLLLLIVLSGPRAHFCNQSSLTPLGVRAKSRWKATARQHWSTWNALFSEVLLLAWYRCCRLSWLQSSTINFLSLRLASRCRDTPLSPCCCVGSMRKVQSFPDSQSRPAANISSFPSLASSVDCLSTHYLGTSERSWCCSFISCNHCCTNIRTTYKYSIKMAFGTNLRSYYILTLVINWRDEKSLNLCTYTAACMIINNIK